MGFFSGLLKGIGKGIVSGAKKLFGRRGTAVEVETPDEYEMMLEAEKNFVRPFLLDAQKRYDEIKQKNYFSTAIDYADTSGGRFSESKLDSMKTIEEVHAEGERVQVFLKDETSTLTGALVYDGKIHAEMGGIIGGAHTAGDSELWEAFRKIAELDPVGISSYGSDNLINAMYNGVIHGHEALTYGIELLNAQYEERQGVWHSVTNNSLPFEW